MDFNRVDIKNNQADTLINSNSNKSTNSTKSTKSNKSTKSTKLTKSTKKTNYEVEKTIKEGEKIVIKNNIISTKLTKKIKIESKQQELKTISKSQNKINLTSIKSSGLTNKKQKLITSVDSLSLVNKNIKNVIKPEFVNKEENDLIEDPLASNFFIYLKSV